MPLEAVDAVVGVATHEEAHEAGAGVKVEHLCEHPYMTSRISGGFKKSDKRKGGCVIVTAVTGERGSKI